MLVTCLIISLFLNTSTVSAGITDNLNLALKNALSILEKKVDNQSSSITSLESKMNAQGSRITSLESKVNNNPSTKWPPEVAYKSPGDTFTIGKYTYFIFSKSDSKMRVISLEERTAIITNLVSDAASLSNPEFITLKNNNFNVATPSTDVSSDNYALLTKREVDYYELPSGGYTTSEVNTTSAVLGKLSYLFSYTYLFDDIICEYYPDDNRHLKVSCSELYIATYNGGRYGYFRYYPVTKWQGVDASASLHYYPVYTILPNS